MNEKSIHNEKLLADFDKEMDEVYWRFINECADVIERLGLSKVPNAGSLKSDEACSFAYIAEREIKNLRYQLAESQKKGKFLDDILTVAETMQTERLPSLTEWLHFQYPATWGDKRLNDLLEKIEAAHEEYKS